MKRKAVIIECDNPECDNAYEYDKDEEPLGVYLKGRAHIGGGGGPVPDTYACSFACVGPAVEAVFDKGWRG